MESLDRDSIFKNLMILMLSHNGFASEELADFFVVTGVIFAQN